MISDLTGRTTEPVIRKRITSVARIDDRQRERQVAGEARLQVDEVGGGAADQDRRPGRRRQRADRFTVAWLASETNGLAEIAWTR